MIAWWDYALRAAVWLMPLPFVLALGIVAEAILFRWHYGRKQKEPCG
jgi:hypothetical protein